MKSRRVKLSPAFLGGLFSVIGLAGVLFFGWGELRLAFLLLIYCLVIIGSRLDYIARLLESIDRQMAAGGARPMRPPDADPHPPETQIPP